MTEGAPRHHNPDEQGRPSRSEGDPMTGRFWRKLDELNARVSVIADGTIEVQGYTGPDEDAFAAGWAFTRYSGLRGIVWIDSVAL